MGRLKTSIFRSLGGGLDLWNMESDFDFGFGGLGAGWADDMKKDKSASASETRIDKR